MRGRLLRFLDAMTKYLLYGGCFSPNVDLETLGGALIREGALIRDNTVYVTFVVSSYMEVCMSFVTVIPNIFWYSQLL